VQAASGRTGQCWGQTPGESFFATIKGELLEHDPGPPTLAARAAILRLHEGWYNTRRRTPP